MRVLRACGEGLGCFKLTDKALLHIGQNANALWSLNISSLKRITDQGLIVRFSLVLRFLFTDN